MYSMGISLDDILVMWFRVFFNSEIDRCYWFLKWFTHNTLPCLLHVWTHRDRRTNLKNVQDSDTPHYVRLETKRCTSCCHTTSMAVFWALKLYLHFKDSFDVISFSQKINIWFLWSDIGDWIENNWFVWSTLAVWSFYL